MLITPAQLTNDSSYDEVAQAIIYECIRRGYTRADGIPCLGTAVQESRLNPKAVSPNGQWKGIYQQDGGYPGRGQASSQITGFFDRLDTKRKSSGASNDNWLNCFWLQQRPGEPSADVAYANGRKAYLTEIKSQTSEATRLWDKYAPGYTGGTPVGDPLRPDFNEINEIGLDVDANGNYRHASVRSRPPINWFFHTEQPAGSGIGKAYDDAAIKLSAYLRSTSGTSAVSYHYTGRTATDGGTTIVDVVDTDYYSWSVLNANVFSINACIAASKVEWTRDEWMLQAKTIDAFCYLAVQDAKKYNFSVEVIKPPYGKARSGISDHKYVTECLGIGTHTDCGPNFPWDYVEERVAVYAKGVVVTPPPVIVTPPPAPVQWYKSLTDRELLEYLVQQAGPADPNWPSAERNEAGQLLTFRDTLAKYNGKIK